MFLVWGTELEKHYGTLFYAAINLQLCLLSNLMTIGVTLFQTYYLKHIILGQEVGGFNQLMKCAVGYSNILFGIMMLEALMGGDRERSLFGIVKVKKVYIPAIMMIII